MKKVVNGYMDIHAILMNERKVGGVIEADQIKLRTGEEFSQVAITNIDYCGSVFYSLTFIDCHGERMLVNVQDISQIEAPTHKRIVELENQFYKKVKTEEKLKYLKRLCEVNEGACTALFLQEVKEIVDDIGIESVSDEFDVPFLNKNVYNIA